jgi:penicillin-binding protein 1A
MGAPDSGPDNSSAPAPRGAARAHPWLRAAGRALAGLVGLAAAAVLAVVIGVGIALAVAYPNLPDLASITEYRPKLPMRVYSADGELLGEFGEERRNFTPVAEIPKVMRDAVLAIEDARFYQHRGVDYIGVIRAGLANFGEARSQGASTITMQVARNFYLSSEKTFIRKVYEILLALKIESQLSKDQILELYMNQIYLGQRAYGFAAACETYFGKPLQEVTIAEAAMLAGLPKSPSRNNPIANPKRAASRQQYIIDRMLENAFITPEQAEVARAQPLVYRQPEAETSHGDFVAEAARQLMFQQYGEEAYSRGLHVHLTIDSVQQLAAYKALRRGILDYERRQPWRGPEGYIDLPADPAALADRIDKALTDHPDHGDLMAAVVVGIETNPRRVSAVLSTGETIVASGDGVRPVQAGLSDKANPNQRIRPGAILRAARNAKGDWTLTQLPEVEGAFVALDPRSGEVKALVGGFDYRKNKFNHVTQAWRQPGSSFKPFIYSAALEKGFMPSTMVNDAPLFFDADATGSQPWEPKNYDGKFEGPMSLRRALAKSKNMVSIRVLQNTGPEFAQDWVTRFGFEAARHPAYLTMALGAGSVTPMQMATAYGVFANGGYYVAPQLIGRVTDDRGRVLFESKPTAPTESMRAIDARNAFLMTSLLQEVTRSGTAARAQGALKRPDVYGKTGTTNDSMDAWFAGWQPSLVAVVWLGYDNPRSLGDRETGGGLSLPVWIEFMGQALKGVPVAEATPPEGVVNLGGEWYFEEFSPGQGVGSVGLEETAAPQAPTEDERKSILDLFKR